MKGISRGTSSAVRGRSGARPGTSRSPAPRGTGRNATGPRAGKGMSEPSRERTPATGRRERETGPVHRCRLGVVILSRADGGVWRGRRRLGGVTLRCARRRVWGRSWRFGFLGLGRARLCMWPSRMRPVTANGPAPGERRRGYAPGMGGRSGKTVVRDRAGNRVLWRSFGRDGPAGCFGIGQIVVNGQAIGFAFLWDHGWNPDRKRVYPPEYQGANLPSSVFRRHGTGAGGFHAIRRWVRKASALAHVTQRVWVSFRSSSETSANAPFAITC